MQAFYIYYILTKPIKARDLFASFNEIRRASSLTGSEQQQAKAQ